MRTRECPFRVLLSLCCLLLPAIAYAQTPECTVPGYPSPTCPTAKDPNIPYCSYYDRFPYGVGFHHIPGLVDALDCNLNDYGSLFIDASRFGCCPETVQRILFQKMEAQLRDSGFSHVWLGGGDIMLLASTALQLGGQGALPVGLHNLVLDALNQYISSNTPLFPCPLDRSNTCMDDYTVAAAGFAWAAAYYQLNGMPTEAANASNRAKAFIHQSFDQMYSVCLHRVGMACNQCELITDATSLQNAIANDTIEVVTYNRGDNPNYGAGLQTLLSAAFHGLEIAGQPYDVTDPLDRILAQGMVRHAQRRLSSPTVVCQPWGDHCYTGDPSCSTQSCTDLGYRPGMYPVRPVLQQHFSINNALPLIRTDVYQFDQFCDMGFHACNRFFGDGRLAIYDRLAFEWPYARSRPVLAGRTAVNDFNPPMLDVDVPAHLEVITGKTYFFGWAIDRETAVASVSFTLDGVPIALEGYNYGGSRQDVCDHFGLAKCPYCPSGWAGYFDPSSYPNKTYLLRVTARSVNGQTTSYDRHFVISHR